MHDVVIRPCGSYQDAKQALAQVLAPLGGLEWVRPGMKIAIKANLVSMMKPERAATTHPDLLCALTELLKERGAEVVLGDSPGGLYNLTYVNRVYAATGMHQVEAAGAVLNRDFSQAEANFPEAVSAKTFAYTRYLDDCDAIINFCKLKSHGMMGLSAAAKNLFGVVPGTIKPEYHFRFPTPEQFSHMIVDLNEYFKPCLSICDAVVAMEGNGPTQGTPRTMGALLAAENPHKLDVLAATLIGLVPGNVPTIRAAFERGLTPLSAEELCIDGDYKRLVAPDFDRIEHYRSMHFAGTGTTAWEKLRGWVVKTCMQSRPEADKKECIGCKACEKICPAKAITMKNGLPVIDRKICIGCFCCQEFCTNGAMKVVRPPIGKLLNRGK